LGYHCQREFLRSSSEINKDSNNETEEVSLIK
jgi:hypothetical protein